MASASPSVPQSVSELNFLACIHGLKFVAGILRDFLSPIIESKHVHLLQKKGSSICKGVHKAIDKKKQTFKEPCTAHADCDVSGWLPDLLNDHKGKVFDGNVTPDDLVNNYWQIALLYMDRGHGVHTSAELTDMSGLVNVCFNCMPVYQILMTPPDAIPALEQVRVRRNELKHNENLTLSSQQKFDVYDDLINLVQNPVFSKVTVRAKQKLLELRDSKVFHDSLESMLSELLSPDGAPMLSLPKLLQNTETDLQAVLRSSRHGQEIQVNARRVLQVVRMALDFTTESRSGIEVTLRSIDVLLDVLNIRQKLKAAYRRQLKHHRLISSAFSHLDVPLNDIFVDLQVEKDEAKRHKGLKGTRQTPKKIIDKLEDVLPDIHLEGGDSTTQSKDTHSSRIIIGGAGTGKSVLTQMLTLRYAETDQSLSKLSPYSLCFYCKAKDLIRVSGDSVHQRILKILKVQEIGNTRLKEVLSASGRILTIIDGLDEISGHDDIKSLVNESLADNSLNGVTLVTSRPETWDMKDFNMILLNKGFGTAKIYQFITHIFKILGNERHIDDVTQLIKTNPKLQEICAAPLVLTIICILVNQDYLHETTSKTKIYSKLVDFVKERLQKDRGVMKNIATRQFELLNKAAYFCLVNDHTYSIEKTPTLVQYMGEDNLDELIAALPDLGLLTPEVYFSVEDVAEKSTFTFCHKTFGEFCAAHYVCSMDEVNLTTSMHNILSESQQLEELLKFIWGIATHQQQSALPHLATGVLQFILQTAQQELAVVSTSTASVTQLVWKDYNGFRAPMSRHLSDVAATCHPTMDTVARLHAALSVRVPREQLAARGLIMKNHDQQGTAVLVHWVVESHAPTIQRIWVPTMADAGNVSVGGALPRMTALRYLSLVVFSHKTLRAICGTTDRPHILPALTELSLQGNDDIKKNPVDGCLGALVCAAAPTLSHLELTDIPLGESVAGVARWVERAAHIHTLSLIRCRLTAAVFEHQVAPAVLGRQQPLQELVVYYKLASGDEDHWAQIRERLSGVAQDLDIKEEQRDKLVALIPVVQALVLCDYEAEDDTGMSCAKGDVVKVWSRPFRDTMYDVELGGKRGLIPIEYLSLLQEVQVVVTKDFTTGNEVKPNFSEGDLLTLEINNRDRWMLVVAGRDGIRGLIPIDHTTNPQVVPVAAMCDACGEDPIQGVRWKCCDCPDYDLCSNCHMLSRHNPEHEFLQISRQGVSGLNIPQAAASGILADAPIDDQQSLDDGIELQPELHDPQPPAAVETDIRGTPIHERSSIVHERELQRENPGPTDSEAGLDLLLGPPAKKGKHQ